MPTFDFRCSNCNMTFERFVWDREHIPLCPQCHSSKVERLFTVSNLVIKDKYPLWVDRIDDWQKRQEDKGKEPTLPAARDVL